LDFERAGDMAGCYLEMAKKFGTPGTKPTSRNLMLSDEIPANSYFSDSMELG
jgi:hypothetical protein